MRSALLLVVAFLVAVPACGTKASRPVVAVALAPEPLRSLRLHVHNATHERAAKEGENVTGFTTMARAALARTLVRAGYVMVVSRDQPHDLEVQVDTDYQWTPKPGALVTSVTFRATGKVIEQLSRVIGVDEDVELDDRDVAALVDALGRSEALARFAAALKRAGPAVPEIAAPAPSASR